MNGREKDGQFLNESQYLDFMELSPILPPNKRQSPFIETKTDV